MSRTENRIAQLEAEVRAMGEKIVFDRMAERLRGMSDTELKALTGALDHYMRTGEVMPGLVETLKGLCQP